MAIVLLFNMVQLPKQTGESVCITAHGFSLNVKKLRRCEYFARIDGNQRGRFGDADQIREDIAQFLNNGTLPRSKTNWY